MMCEDLYQKLFMGAAEHKTLSHYTTINALEKILSNKSLRLSKLELVNDLFEVKRLSDIWKNKIYIYCFTHRRYESVMFWEMYAKKENGVMITFKNLFNENIRIYGDEKCCDNELIKIERSDIKYKQYKDISDYGYYDIAFADIEYTDNFEQFLHTNKEMKDFFYGVLIGGEKRTDFTENLYQGLIKGIEWDSEEETRLRVTLRPKGMETVKDGIGFIQPMPNFDYIYLKLTHELTNNMIVTLNPWATEEFGKEIELLMQQSKITNCTIKESSLRGKIK